jgi:type II secretory pathway component PulF
MNASSPPPVPSFAYRAQTREGIVVSGTIIAAGVEAATQQLALLQLRVIEIAPVAGGARPAPLRGDDFVAFNQQLAHLTKAGLPLEQGLRLIAQDMRSGRLSATVNAIASELEQGRPIGEAFAAHQSRFPSLYGELLEAGVRTNNLPGMLLNLARHMELVGRLRQMVWKAVAYPLSVLAGLLLVLAFLGIVVLPQFEAMFSAFKVPLPDITRMLLMLGRTTPYWLAAVLVLVVATPVAWAILRARGMDRVAHDRLLLPLPLIGPVLKRNLIAAWCNALRMGVEAGLDLPRAIRLAGDATGSPVLKEDGQFLSEWLERGEDPRGATGGRLLPPTVAAAIALGIEQHELPATLGSLSEMYQEQAETRLALLPGVLSPLLLLLVAGTIGFVVVGAVLMPAVRLIVYVSGGKW